MGANLADWFFRRALPKGFGERLEKDLDAAADTFLILGGLKDVDAAQTAPMRLGLSDAITDLVNAWHMAKRKAGKMNWLSAFVSYATGGFGTISQDIEAKRRVVVNRREEALAWLKAHGWDASIL
jgi:hypothetical protein